MSAIDFADKHAADLFGLAAMVIGFVFFWAMARVDR